MPAILQKLVRYKKEPLLNSGGFLTILILLNYKLIIPTALRKITISKAGVILRVTKKKKGRNHSILSVPLLVSSCAKLLRLTT